MPHHEEERVPNKKCVFCDIIGGRSPASKVIFENEKMMIIEDIKPASDVHYLALPKQHIADCRHLTMNDKSLIQEMEQELKNLFVAKQLDINDASFGFHWPPFTSISHLHMHAIAPVSKMGFISRWIFKPINIWYCTPQYVILKNLEEKHT